MNIKSDKPGSEQAQDLQQPGYEPPVSPTTLAILLSVAGIALLILPEIWLSIAAFVWAASGLLHLPTQLSIVLWLICLPAGMWASWHTIKLAWRSANPEDGESGAG